jgi:CheY-like chemotaxis protein
MRTVLVVDDEFGVAEVIEAILEDEGYRVLTAVNGRQGLVRLAENRPDLVLLDMMMPILDGPAMLKAMKAEPQFADIPVVMMSSLDPRSVDAECSGYVAFLRKPFRAAAVTDLVARLIGPGPKD